MYVVFRDDLISSDEIKDLINENHKFKVETDLTKATKREDVMAFKLSIPVKDIDISTPFDWENDNVVEEYFNHIEGLTKDFLQYFPRYTIQKSMTYKWDEIEDSLLLVVVIANIDITMKKLELDILKRMMKQVD